MYSKRCLSRSNFFYHSSSIITWNNKVESLVLDPYSTTLPFSLHSRKGTLLRKLFLWERWRYLQIPNYHRNGKPKFPETQLIELMTRFKARFPLNAWMGRVNYNWTFFLSKHLDGVTYEHFLRENLVACALCWFLRNSLRNLTSFVSFSKALDYLTLKAFHFWNGYFSKIVISLVAIIEVSTKCFQ